MDNKEDITPIQPFDVTIGENYSMYDQEKYKRDLSLFNENAVMMERGNIIKYYNAKDTKPYKIPIHEQ
jgi:hypothetical protein